MMDVKDLTSFKWGTVTGTTPLAVKLDGDSLPLALIPDSLVDPLELSVGSRVRVELSLRKVVVHGVANGGGVSGEVKMIATPTPPAGWLLCQGQSLLRTQYPRLFAALGTTYGAADSTHFNLPDMRGRVAVGRDASQTEFDVLGEAGGAKTHTLTTAEMPSHTHKTGISTTLAFGAAGGGYSAVVGFAQNNADTSPAGSGAAHNNLQPYLTLNYIIKI